MHMTINRKIESEKTALTELRNCYEESDIEKVLKYLVESGTPPSGKPCHSPLAYMAVAMNELLQHVNQLEEVAKRKKANQEQKEAEAKAKIEQERAEEQ